MKFFSLSLAVMALAVPVGLLLNSGQGDLMVDRSAHVQGVTHSHAAGRDYASR